MSKIINFLCNYFFITKEMDKALNINEVRELSGRPINFFLFDEIEELEDFDDLFPESDCTLIMYRTTDNFGHYCCMNKLDDRYDFLDSYGIEIDDQRKSIPEKFRKKSGQEYPYILRLIAKKKNFPKVHYNNIQLQKYGNNINTCGRYCGMFMRFPMPVEEFVKSIQNGAKKYNVSNDQLITDISEPYLLP